MKTVVRQERTQNGTHELGWFVVEHRLFKSRNMNQIPQEYAARPTESGMVGEREDAPLEPTTVVFGFAPSTSIYEVLTKIGKFCLNVVLVPFAISLE